MNIGILIKKMALPLEHGWPIIPKYYILLHFYLETRFRRLSSAMYVYFFVTKYRTVRVIHIYFQSNLFSLEHFSMGLSMEQLQLFRNKRLFSSVLCEDGVQIILQIWFIMETHFGLNMELNTIALLSSIFSFISILLTFISYLTSRTLLRNEEKVVITFDIINDEVRDKRYHYQRRIIGFKGKYIFNYIPFNIIDH